jgi:hypothetical protein
MHGVLSRGLLSGSRPTTDRDFRAHLPRFTGENRERNDRLIAALQRLAAEKAASASQLAIAWVLAKSKSIVPLVGARTRAQLTESLGALRVELSPDEVARLEEAIRQPPSRARATTRARCGSLTANGSTSRVPARRPSIRSTGGPWNTFSRRRKPSSFSREASTLRSLSTNALPSAWLPYPRR